MKIVQGDEVAIDGGKSLIREGSLTRRIILTGDEGSPGNFLFGVYYQTGDFFSPRHTHNFDQWRFQLEGSCGFDRNGNMTPETIGYFPEGAYYGPQSSNEPNATVVMQFGPPSGNGFLSQRQIRAGSEEMKSYGHFADGLFHRNDGVPGKKTLDSFAATWEHVNGRPMVPARPQYADPLLMHCDNYRWMPVDGAPGVEEKSFGTFTDCRIRGGRYRLAPGATLHAEGRGVFFVLDGTGSVENVPYRRLTSVYVETGETAAFTASEPSEVLLLGLPEIGRMRTPLREPAAAETATA